MDRYEEVWRKMSNKDLLNILSRRRMEKENPSKFVNSKYVTASEFYHGHFGALKSELRRRQKLGKISSSAGKSRKKPNPLGIPTLNQLMRM